MAKRIITVMALIAVQAGIGSAPVLAKDIDVKDGLRITAKAGEPVIDEDIDLFADQEPALPECKVVNLGFTRDVMIAASERWSALDQREHSELDAQEAKLDRIQRLLRASRATEAAANGYSKVPGCTKARGSDLYEPDGAHKTIQSHGKAQDLVRICENYVESKAQKAVEDVEKPLADAKSKWLDMISDGQNCYNKLGKGAVSLPAMEDGRDDESPVPNS